MPKSQRERRVEELTPAAGRRLSSLLVVAAFLFAPRVAGASTTTVTFPARSWVTPIDTTYQDPDVLQAFGLVDKLLHRAAK